MSSGPRTGMSETESMESLSSTASSIQAQIQQARAHGLMSRNIIQHDHETNGSNGVLSGPPVLRSDSFKVGVWGCSLWLAQIILITY